MAVYSNFSAEGPKATEGMRYVIRGHAEPLKNQEPRGFSEESKQTRWPTTHEPDGVGKAL